jgi:hypothetical protein
MPHPQPTKKQPHSSSQTVSICNMLNSGQYRDYDCSMVCNSTQFECHVVSRDIVFMTLTDTTLEKVNHTTVNITAIIVLIYFEYEYWAKNVCILQNAS